MIRTIRGIRNDLGFNQQEMADKLNVTYATYQRYERYETVIPATVIIKIADLAHIIDVREIKNH